MSQSISLRGISKGYGAVAALEDVALDINAGEFFTLLGPSGSGKTTLLMVLAGFTRPDRGSLRIGGVETVRLPPHRRDIGVVFQNYALFPHMNVADNVAYPLKLRGVAKTTRYARTRDALSLVRLEGYEGRRINELSGGQKQRVALARAIVFSPRILLMDEPLSALDKHLREHMQIELKGLQRTLGITTVYVTHDQAEAITMSDRIAIVNHGRIVQVGTPRDVYERPKDRFVATFIGESSLVPVSIAGGAVHFGAQALNVALSKTLGGAAAGHLVLRPERLQILSAPPHEELNCLPATIRNAIYQGDSTFICAALADGTELFVRQPLHRQAPEIPEPGRQVHVAFHPDDGIVVPEAS